MVSILAKVMGIETLPVDKKRSAYGKLCGIVGIVLNILLFAGKFLAGWLSNSIAITADAFNNLSDAGSSLVTLIGFKLADQNQTRIILSVMEEWNIWRVLWYLQSFL